MTEEPGNGVDGRLLDRINQLRIDTPSWGYADSGTRFKVFTQEGAARTIEQKIADAGLVNRLTGVCPNLAIHIPWDQVDDWAALRALGEQHGITFGAINPNLFQDDAYMLGSLAHPRPEVRTKAINHCVECISVAEQVGSKTISLWLGDGTNYAGQDDLRARRRRLIESLKRVYVALPDDYSLHLEYKFFEPAFYATDIPDWGTALSLCAELGPRARVLVDTGHHAQGVNIEQIVAQLLDGGRLGGFHFNARKYGDDDLIVGSTNPFELFLIFNELVSAEDDTNQGVAEAARQVVYTIDQSHNVEPKLEAMIQSVINIQVAHAKALLVDRARLQEAQAAEDVLGAHRLLTNAYETDVRPYLAAARTTLGLDPDPLAALHRSGYVAEITSQRGKAVAASAFPSS